MTRLPLAEMAVIADEGARTPRVLVFDPAPRGAVLDPRSLIAVASIHRGDLRVATARAAVTDRIRRAVQAALGPLGRYRGRAREDPFEFFLNPPGERGPAAP